ncbi:MAG TPA: cyclic nucleotide-binding domain-containing protein [Methylomirabilota bacterium]|jgi:CRP/FNR family transcriptional regulator|nr:cyclic nucleotide-binding domain-containing protein [Methylomirabilota bacterium]
MLLRTAYLFQDLSEASLEAIAGIAAEQSHTAGTFLFRADDPATGLYILAEGRVRLSVIRGGALAHTVSEPGEAMGWSSMAGLPVYTASAECTAPTTVIRIPSDRLMHILEHDPASGFKFFRRLAMHIGVRLVESYGGTLSLHGQKGAGSYG